MKKKLFIHSSSLGILLIISAIISLSIGSHEIGFSDIFNILIGKDNSEIIKKIIYEIRLPRVLLSILAGAGLSVSGAVFQSLLRNPLAEPYILGISGGAAVGTLISILIGFHIWFIATPIMAFLGSIIVVLGVYFLGSRFGVLDTNMLLLSGVMIGAFLSAIILFLVMMMGAPVRNALQWLLGNFGNADLNSVLFILPITLLSVFFIYINSNKLNLIITGDEEAMHLGVNVEKVKRISYIFASLLTSSIVSLSGTIGFVGLIIPHICRLLYGPDNRLLIPMSFFLGGIFMIFIDILSRVILYPIELPIGALTAIIGAPIFILLLKRKP